MREFLMPKLGADMASGRLVAWHVKAGDRVARGDVVAEVDTDKGIIDVESFAAGVVERLVAQPGDTVAVGAVLALMAEETAAAAEQPPVRQVSLPPLGRPDAPTGPFQALPETAAAHVAATPSARRLAHESGIELAKVTGTGPGGAVTRQDVERARGARGETPGEVTPVAIGDRGDRAARMRQSIAAAMSRSHREIPHYYLATTIDMQRALDWLKSQNETLSTSERMLYGVLLIKSVALALREMPEFNSTWNEGRVVPGAGIHVGVAISLRMGGLVAPAIHDTDRCDLRSLMVKLRDLVQRARGGALRSSELADPTITVTNLGEQGVESVYGVIYPPQVALVGFGKIVERPSVVAGAVVPRPLMIASLAADHRVSDGHSGARFLTAIERLLQEPEKL